MPHRESKQSVKRPFDIIAEAGAVWQAGSVAHAEALFKQGIQAYERQEPSGINFALGRYGAFLLAQARREEALRVLRQAINNNTDLPLIWSDYIRILADQRDLEGFKFCIERMAQAVRYRIVPEFLLAHARRAGQEGDFRFAEAVARWVLERANVDGDKGGRWAAVGDLGRILERQGRLVEGVALWQGAFDEGSCDPETANRLSMQLERTKDYAATSAVIREALTRGLPANVEESLRKRLVRCESKTADKVLPKTAKPEIAAYSIRRASTSVEPIFQSRLKPSIRNIALIGGVARCVLTEKESSALVDVDFATGKHLRRVDEIPRLGDAYFAPGGQVIGVRRTGAVGKGPTLLTFIDAEGRVVAKSSVPDATSEVAIGPDTWYVGCRNGFLYAFGLDGRARWFWETPGARDYNDDAYFRPCPYHIASHESFAAVVSMGNVYAVAPNGETLWQVTLPNDRQRLWEFTIPVEVSTTMEEAFHVLGLPVDAGRDRVESAYRRLALATQPDRNGYDNNAADNFRRIQDAYETILAGPDADTSDPPTVTVSMEMQGLGPSASFVAANRAGVLVGSSQGRLYFFNENGGLREARVLGNGFVRAALRPDGTVGAAWCGNALLLFKDDQIINAKDALDWPSGLTMLGDDVVLWRGNKIQLADPDGHFVWSVEFSKSITSVAVRGDTLVCAAGVLAAFRRST
jgi:tetratricopeptide (TPR) repeat protein